MPPLEGQHIRPFRVKVRHALVSNPLGSRRLGTWPPDRGGRTDALIPDPERQGKRGWAVRGSKQRGSGGQLPGDGARASAVLGHGAEQVTTTAWPCVGNVMGLREGPGCAPRQPDVEGAVSDEAVSG